MEIYRKKKYFYLKKLKLYIILIKNILIFFLILLIFNVLAKTKNIIIIDSKEQFSNFKNKSEIFKKNVIISILNNKIKILSEKVIINFFNKKKMIMSIIGKPIIFHQNIKNKNIKVYAKKVFYKIGKKHYIEFLENVFFKNSNYMIQADRIIYLIKEKKIKIYSNKKKIKIILKLK